MYSPLLETKKGTGAEIHLGIASGIVTGDAPVSYWPTFSMSLVRFPEVFAKVNLTHFPIECFHSRGQHLCKFIEAKESV